MGGDNFNNAPSYFIHLLSGAELCKHFTDFDACKNGTATLEEIWAELLQKNDLSTVGKR